MPNAQGVRSALDLGSRPVGSDLVCKDPSRAKQSSRDECDINNIMRKYHKTGLLPSRAGEGLYVDASTLGDYHAACNQILAAEELFASLPSKVRSRFKNDPAELIAACSDPKNLPELVELGLANPEALRRVAPDTPPSQPSPDASKPASGGPASSPT